MAEIELTDLTNTKTCSTEDDGTGVFDKLIKSVEYHIEGQYKSGRIKGTDYANVYLGSMQSVLSESIKFLLSEQKADKEADLVAAQISELELNGVVDRSLKAAQEADVVKGTELTGAKLDDQVYVTDNLRPLEAESASEAIDLIIAQTAAQ